MKKYLIITICFLAILNVSTAEVMDRIIAKVGRDIILESELETRKQQLTATGMISEDIEDIDIINEMVESKIILQKAKKELYEVDEIEVNILAEEQINRISQDFSSSEEFHTVLMNEMGLTVLEIKGILY